MREVLRSNDIVLLNFVVVLLTDAGLSPQLVDEHVSAIEGSIGALPRRILIDADELAQARRVLTEAELSQWLASDAQ